MSAYVVVDIEVIDPVRYEDYKPLAHAAVTAWGGRYVARGGQTEVLEGEWQPRRLVILEFPTVQQAMAWWASDDYSPAKKLRQETARTNMVVVEGM
jgi:uncharacterized protein (DUF1330 family)